MSLEELYNAIQDLPVSDPSAMDKINEYSKNLEEEHDEFMKILIEKVNLTTITWTQPWYQQSQCLTRAVVNDNRNKSITFRTDRFDYEEEKRIRKNWRKFRKIYDVPDKLISLAQWKNKKTNNHKLPEERVRRFIIAYLARGVERTLKQVYRHVSTLYGGAVRGFFTPIERKIMDICFHHEARKGIPTLAMILNREPRGIYKIYSSRIKTPEFTKLTWTLPLATKFLHLIMKHTGLSLQELKYKKIKLSIWKELESQMSIPYVKLRYYWYATLHVKLFAKDVPTMRSLQKKIYKKLAASEYRIWPDIRWNKLVKDFPDGFTHEFLYAVAHRTIKAYENYSNVPLKEVAEYGLQHLQRKKLCLKPVRLNEDGNLEIVVPSKSEL